MPSRSQKEEEPQMKHYPFVDSRIIAQAYAMRREVQQPRLLADTPVMPDAQAYGSVLRDQNGQWRMWYLGDPAYCEYYAVSEDGLNWRRPGLALVAPELRGELNGPNAFLSINQRDIHGKWLVQHQGPEGFCVLDADQTPHPAAKARFTALYLARMDTGSGMYIAHSDDGIHWRAERDQPVISGWRDTSSVLFYDPRLKKYVWYGRPDPYAASAMHANRLIARRESDDLLHWTPDQIVMDTDEADADAFAFVDEAALRAGTDITSAATRARAWAELTEGARTGDNQPLIRGRNRQWYGITVFPYAAVYLGIAWMYDVPSGEMWTELVHSYDGMDWRREAIRGSFMPRVDGVCTCTMASPPVLVGDELWLYDSVKNRNHHGVVNPGVSRGIRALALRRDRWVGYTAGTQPGEIMTQVLDKPATIAINGVTGEHGWIKVAVTNAEGIPLEGFTQADGEPLSGDSLDLRPRWRHNRGLEIIKNQVVRIRLSARNATIYSLDIKKE